MKEGGRKVAIVTGCSGGIGFHTALKLSQRAKYTVVATVRNPSEAPKELLEHCDVQALDVTSEADAERLASHVKQTHGGCDVLVNNAGFGVAGSVEEVTVADGRRVFDVNVWGVVRMIQHFAPQMRAKGGGLIIGISSTSGVAAVPGFDLYSGSKHALEGILSGYRYVVQNDNIKIALINPGPVADTAFGARVISEEKIRQTQKAEEGTRNDSDGGVSRSAVTDWADRLAGRLRTMGQSVESCTDVILDVVLRDVDKCVVDGKDSVPLWNGTSDYADRVINDILKRPDGYSGIYAERFVMGREGVGALPGK